MNERSIFLAALEISDEDERQEYLDEACGDDESLHEQVRQLLVVHEDADGFLEKPPVAFVATIATGDLDTVDEDIPEIPLDFLETSDKPSCVGTLGPYEVIEVVGRGGMGIVLRAYDTKLNRVVAIKVLAPELAANAMAVKRFLREARAAAAVSHDHVVTIHAIDEENRPPFIVMEFVDGFSLQEKIDRTGALELKEILRIGMQMARGLGAAHEQGLVHRDIKPANILLENGVERVKLTDFGLARAVDDVSVTQTGQIAGTPQFMSPEQAQGQPIDARSDLFSLGSVLYTMCTGRPPFRAATAVAMLRRVTDDDPRPIREVNAEVPEWLEAIVFKLLAKDPDERFQAAEEVAALSSQHLAHLQHPTTAPKPQPVVPPIRGADFQPATPSPKPVGYKPAPQTRSRGPLVAVGVALGVFIMLAAATIAAVVFYIKTDYGTIRVEVNDPNTTVTIDNEMGLSFENSNLKGGLKVRAGDHRLHIKQGDLEFETDKFRVRRGEEVVVSVELIDGGLAARLSRPERLAVENGSVTYQRDRVIGLQRKERWIQRVAIQTNEGTYWRYTGENKPVMTDAGQVGPAETFQFVWQDEDHTQANVRTPDDLYLRGLVNRSKQLVAMNELGSSDLFHVEWLDRRNQRFRLRTRDGQYVSATPGGEYLTLTSRQSKPGVFTLTPLSADKRHIEVRRFAGHTGFITGVAFFSGGKRALSASTDGTLRIWDVQTGIQLKKINTGHALSALAVSPDEKFAAVGVEAGENPMELWHLEKGERTGSLAGHPDGRAVKLAFTPDGKRLVSSGYDFFVRVWDVQKQKQERSFQVPVRSNPNITSLSPDGKLLVTCHADGEKKLQLWDLASGAAVHEFHSDSGTCLHTTFSVDGRMLALGTASGTVRMWDVATGKETRRIQAATRPIVSLAFTPDARSLVTGSIYGTSDASLRVWDVATGRELSRVDAETRRFNETAISPDSRFVITGGGFAWDETERRAIDDGDHELHLVRLPASVLPNEVNEIAAEKVTEVRRLEGHTDNVYAVAYSRDGNSLFSSGSERLLYQWDLTTGNVIRKIPVGSSSVRGIAAHPDGRRMVTSQFGGEITMWDLANGRAVRSFPGHSEAVRSLAISPDGARLLTGGFDGLVRLWDIETGETIRSFDEGFCGAVAISNDGRLAAHGNRVGLVVWDVETGQTIRQIERYPFAASALAFSPDGRHVVSGDGNVVSGDHKRLVQVWEVATGKQLYQLDHHTAGIKSVEFTPDGRHFISGSFDKTIRIYALASGREVARTKCGGHHATFLAIAPDGRTLASGGGFLQENQDGQYVTHKDGDYAIRLWRLPESVWPGRRAASRCRARANGP